MTRDPTAAPAQAVALFKSIQERNVGADGNPADCVPEQHIPTPTAGFFVSVPHARATRTRFANSTTPSALLTPGMYGRRTSSVRVLSVGAALSALHTGH